MQRCMPSSQVCAASCGDKCPGTLGGDRRTRTSYGTAGQGTSTKKVRRRGCGAGGSAERMPARSASCRSAAWSRKALSSCMAR
eukprot:scaffold4502_cov119-Isochrysis_galbana.AAC.6